MNLFVICVIYLIIGFLTGLAYVAYEIFTTRIEEDTYYVDYDFFALCVLFWPLVLGFAVFSDIFKGVVALTDRFAKKVIDFKDKVDSGEFEAERNAKKEAKNEIAKKKTVKKNR